jgi:hypothetical protein
MSDQSVYFNTSLSGDTDERASTSAILPIVAGEKVRAAVVNRPFENLRSRTEVLREQTEEQKFLKDSDMRWLITGGNTIGTATGNDMPKVTWTPASNKFTVVGGLNDVTACIILQPIQGPKVDKKGTQTYAFTGTYSGSVTISTTYFAYEGGARHQVIWAEAAAAGLGTNKCSVVFSGTPEHVMTITVATEGTTTLQNLKDQFTAVGMNRSGFAATTSGSLSTLLEYSQRVTAADTDVTFVATYDRELHYITKAQIDYFFVTMGKTILSGDTLGIYYPFMVDPDNPTTRGGRRQATPTSAPGGGGANTAVTAAQLFISSDYPEKIAQSIPICKRIGDDLIFIDGTVVRGDEPTTPAGTVYFGTNGYTLQGFGDTTPYADAGAFKIGVAAHTAHSGASADRFSISAGMLQTVLEALQLFVNDKASLDADEELTGNWLQEQGATWYVTEASLAHTCCLLWRTGSGRPADGSVTYNTISRYQLNNHGVSIYESMLVTLTGGYLTYDTSWKINTPATGSGNVTVEIEICSAAAAPEHNVRGSYRIYNAAANSQFELLPADVLSSDYTSGFSTAQGNYYLWGNSGDFTAAFSTITLTALYELVIDTHSIQYAPASETTVGTAYVTRHPDITYYGSIYDTGGHGYINRVLDGLTVVPAADGKFGADTITLTPGRAYVAGKLLTLYPTSGSTISVTNVSTTHNTDASFFPASTDLIRWYGVWLRSDGSIRVGSLPDMGLHTGRAGVTGYMIPSGDLESPFSQHDYTLLDIVWCYDYQSGVAHRIRFAGVTDIGGGLHVYHQARKRDWSTLAYTTFIDHNCIFWEINGGSPAVNMGVVISAPSNTYSTVAPGYLPGIPTNISGAAYLGVRYAYQKTTAPHTFRASLLHPNLVDAGAYYSVTPSTLVSTSLIAPPIAGDPLTASTSLCHINLAYDVSGSALSPTVDYYVYPVWDYYEHTFDADSAYTLKSDTVIYPMQRKEANGVGNIAYHVYCLNLGVGDIAKFVVTNLGFFWNRYNPGGIY